MAERDDIKPTETQPAPNISTEHQRDGDARLPSDTLDRDQPSGDDGGRKGASTKRA